MITISAGWAIVLALLAILLLSLTIVSLAAWFGIAREAEDLRARLGFYEARMMHLARSDSDDRLDD